MNFINSYKNRSAAITTDNREVAISNNGIFRPVIIADGKVKGSWKRIVKKEKIETNLKAKLMIK